MIAPAVPELIVNGERWIKVRCRCGTEFWRFAGDDQAVCQNCKQARRDAVLGTLPCRENVHRVHDSQYHGQRFRDD